MNESTIFVVDDDPNVCRAMHGVGQMLNMPVSSYASAGEFLANYSPSQPGCLVLEVRLPGMTGLELQQTLIDRQISMPVIMISGHLDVRMAVEAMSNGAITVLEKPCRLNELTSYIRRAMHVDVQRRATLSRQAQTESQLARLTTKEREVFDLVTCGKKNREIAAELQLSIRAVEDRRSRLMKKLGVKSTIELAQFQPVGASC